MSTTNSVSIVRSLRFPMTGESGTKRVLLGSVTAIIPVFSFGYALWSIRAGLHNEDPPSVSGWWKMLNDGVRVWVAALVYVVLAYLLFGIIGGVLMGLMPDSFAIVVMVSGMLSMLYVLPAAFLGIASSGSIKGAFKFGSIYQVVSSDGYLKLAIVTIVLGGVLGPIFYAGRYIGIGLPLFFVLTAGLGHYVGSGAKQL